MLFVWQPKRRFGVYPEAIARLPHAAILSHMAKVSIFFFRGFLAAPCEDRGFVAMMGALLHFFSENSTENTCILIQTII